MKVRIFYISFLSNVDSSILNIELENSFNIKSMSKSELLNFIQKLKKHNLLFSENVIIPQILFNCYNESENRVYYLQKFCDINIKDKNIISNMDVYSYIMMNTEKTAFGKFHNSSLKNNKQFIQLMRLYKEGDIDTLWSFCYFAHEDDNLMAFWIPITIKDTLTSKSTKDLYIINESEIADLKKIFNDFKLPFSQLFLQLAFENFELSYQTKSLELSFVTLMICLEILFNSSERELRYRISRNAAVLLGRDKESEKSEIIFKNIKDLYDKRSSLVHRGKKEVKKEDLLKLRHYVREAIKDIYRLGKNRDDYLRELNKCGFNKWVSKNR